MGTKMLESVMSTMTMKLTNATLFFTRRLTPSRKKVDDSRICTMYSFSSSVAGMN